MTPQEQANVAKLKATHRSEKLAANALLVALAVMGVTSIIAFS